MNKLNLDRPKIALRRFKQWAQKENIPADKTERVCLALSEYERNRGTQGEEASRKDIATSLAAIGLTL